MPCYFGIDTSNYTTSVALLSDSGCLMKRKLLPVKEGSLGLRQSDAVFHHTRQLPELVEALFSEAGKAEISAVGVSVRPRGRSNSYMPCFSVGAALARSVGSILGVPVCETSHQTGHVLAALYSAGRMDLTGERFIAFHVSGGTTDCLLVTPDDGEIINIDTLSSSLDLKAGQAIDRVGVMLGLPFPCGPSLEALAERSGYPYKDKLKPTMRGLDCSLSGIENRCHRLLDESESPENIAAYCIESVYSAIREMTAAALSHVGKMPILYAGGVMSNSYIRRRITEEFGGFFAEPQFSCDNAAGCACFAALATKGKTE